MDRCLCKVLIVVKIHGNCVSTCRAIWTICDNVVVVVVVVVMSSVDVGEPLCPGCTDTSDPRHFGPKTARHYIFSTEMSYFFVSVPKCLWDTSALVLKCLNILWSAEVSWSDRQRFHVLISLHHLTPHLHHPSRSSDSVSRHSVYTKSKSYHDIHIWLLHIT